jgi:hypothetical protein
MEEMMLFLEAEYFAEIAERDANRRRATEFEYSIPDFTPLGGS